MRVPRLLLLIPAALVITSLASAQAPSQDLIIGDADGSTSRSTESIFIPPIPRAPFSLTLATEWSQPIGNGGTLTMTNERRIMRDSSGRIYQERWVLVPKDGEIKSRMDKLQIFDPEQHSWTNCNTAAKVCEVRPYPLTTQANYQPAIRTSAPLPNGRGFRQDEDLGIGNTLGEDTHGYRETITINAGVMGNDRPYISSREFWYSARLGIDLSSTVDDPQTGKQVFTVKALSTSEPESGFFEVPPGYRVVNHMNRQE